MTTDPVNSPPGPPRGSDDASHWWRIVGIWAVLSIAFDVIWLNFVGPHVPPGRMTDTANGASFDFNVLIVMGVPVMIAVWVYMAYAIITWRAGRGGPDPVGGEQARGNRRIVVTWTSVTTVLVLFLAGFGTYELAQPEGAGGGQGPTPLWTPASHTVLQVQVIGQQWKWTYRYPSFGGFETNVLVIPDNTTIAFHVTSLDVIHDFWAYQLGVKADANPGVDNVAYTPKAFDLWATTTEQQLAANTALLPPFAYSYTPDANGADGGYYPDTADPYSAVETYGAAQPAGT
jgi:cytochrome c oxidase subunit 2